MTLGTRERSLPVAGLLGGLQSSGSGVLPDSTAYVAASEGDGLEYAVRPGELASGWLTLDLLAEGFELPVFALSLHAGERTFELTFGVANGAQARMRFPLDHTDQRRWLMGREGAYLKACCYGQSVERAQIDRVTFTLRRRGDGPVRFSLGALEWHAEEPERLTSPLLTDGPLLDELGQSTRREWSGKSSDAAEVTARLRRQLGEAATWAWPEEFSAWGGDARLSLGASGFFRAHHDGKRWWLVDPDGHPFWSAGQDCVNASVSAGVSGLEEALAWLPPAEGPYRETHEQGQFGPEVDYLKANLIRAFGGEWRAAWAQLALGELRHAGFNTVGNWSAWPQLRHFGFPYVRPLHFAPRHAPPVFRDLPDVFHPGFAQDCAEFAAQLQETLGDPALVGYFLMNEPTWGFARETPAEGLLRGEEGTPARVALADFLRVRYSSDAALSAAWNMLLTFTDLAERSFKGHLNPAALRDLEDFSEELVARFFGGLSAACRQVDPQHLNLGARYYTLPPAWAWRGMREFDVLSVNGYGEQVKPDLEEFARALEKPILIGEFHHGALDVGLPGSGIGRVRDQAARGAAYRRYVEDAAARPWCVGTHHFQLYDESAIGRFDGENCQIGFLDVTHKPYPELVTAARQTHERLYQVATGEVAPFADAPEHLPVLFA